MLESLHISNYALIDTADINFEPGLNIITGETGAGKSIMLGALSMILGGRADTRVVRDHQSKSVIEAIFTVAPGSLLQQYCTDNDIEWDDARCILRREISPNGRSRAFVNDSPVPLAKLEGVASMLIDLHSQNQNQLLTRPEFQLDVIDTLAGNADRLEQYTVRYEALRKATKALRTAKTAIEQTRNDEDFLRFQLTQLDEADIRPDMFEQMQRDRDNLANVTQIKTALATALDNLTEGTVNASEMTDTALTAISQLDGISNPELNLVERLETLLSEINDIAHDLHRINDSISGDPAELESLENRLNTATTLMRRHHVDTPQALSDIRERLRKQLDDLDNAQQLLDDKRREARRMMAMAKEAATALTEARTLAASRLAEEWSARAIPLGMKNLRCCIRIEPADLTSTGADNVTFMFAFNKNQELTPVGNAASGGEISRLMLSLKSIIADKMDLPSIIFDEVDTGVSGDVARRMGGMMRDIGRNIQVIAITHLPQVAAMGNRHLRVAKYDDATSTHTGITLLNAEQRIDELATMLSGRPDDPAGRAAAISLLGQATQS